MHERLRGSKSEPRPDMNIKVAAFTVSEKSSNTSAFYLSSSALCYFSPVEIMLFDLKSLVQYFDIQCRPIHNAGVNQ